MLSLLDKYLRILTVELEDVNSDIDYLIDLYEKREKKGEITDYVYLENIAVLKNEKYGVESFIRILGELAPGLAGFASLDAFIEEIKTRFTYRIDECGFAKVIYPIIERKVMKVYRYVTHT